MIETRPGGRKLMLVSTIGGQLLALVRNILVARFLGPHEFGIAAIIILTISFLDSLGNAGPQTLLTQAKDEDGRPLLAASHSVTLIRGLSTTILLLTIAAPLSALFGLQLSWPAILGLAVAALITAFQHQGVRLVQREGDFRPEAISQLAGEVAALIVAVGSASLTHSHIAIVYGLIARNLVMVGVSQWLAPQGYALNWRKAYLSRFWNFGWPLLINGPLLFFATQADRLIISRELGVATLGAYSAAMVLISSPSFAIMRWIGSIFTPRLAKYYHAHGDLRTREIVYVFTLVSVISAFAMFLGFAAFGREAVTILYGPKYAIAATTVALVGLLQILRYLRSCPTVQSIAVGASAGVLTSTTVRVLLLPLGYVGLMTWGGLEGLLTGFIAGEIIALLLSHLIVNHNARRGRGEGLPTTGVFCAIAAAIVGAIALSGGGFLVRLAMFVLIAAPGAALLALTISRSETERYAREWKSRVA